MAHITGCDDWWSADISATASSSAIPGIERRRRAPWQDSNARCVTMRPCGTGWSGGVGAALAGLSRPVVVLVVPLTYTHKQNGFSATLSTERGEVMADTYSATTIAKWFVDWANSEDAELSNLKLQKLLYYTQGHHLAMYGRPLFRDKIQAWSHGPVVPDVYHEFKGFRSGTITLDDDDPFDWDDVDSEITQFLIKVWNTYGGIAAWKLRNMTHAEPPWKDNFAQGEFYTIIPEEQIQAYFVARTSK